VNEKKNHKSEIACEFKLINRDIQKQKYKDNTEYHKGQMNRAALWAWLQDAITLPMREMSHIEME